MKTTTTHKENTRHAVRSVAQYALQQGYSIAIWRLPNSSKVELILSSERMAIEDLNMEDVKSGFVFAPFIPTKPKYFLRSDHHFEITEDALTEITPGQIKELASHPRAKWPLKFFTGNTNSPVSSVNDFIDLVKLSINAVESGAFEKVVPSMQKKIELHHDFDLLEAFDELNKKYPAAMVSMVSDAAIGTWLGASPELLVSTDRHGIFRTTALAGTQQYQEDVPMRNVSWTQKEIEEQAWWNDT